MGAQATRETAASAAADQMRRDQLALKQSKQLIPILAPASKGKPYKSPAAAHATSVLANGAKTSASLNGNLPRKSSLESLGRMSSQVIYLNLETAALQRFAGSCTFLSSNVLQRNMGTCSPAAWLQ